MNCCCLLKVQFKSVLESTESVYRHLHCTLHWSVTSAEMHMRHMTAQSHVKNWSTNSLVSKSFLSLHFWRQTVKGGNNSEEETFKPLPPWLKWHCAGYFLSNKTSSDRVKHEGQSLVKADGSKIGSLSPFPESRHRNISLTVGILRDRDSTETKKHFYILRGE